jgi:hypothetical protein
MSRYAQPIYSYPHPGYPQPPLHPYPYQQPPGPPVPVYHVDPNAFRREYGSRLAELTINSRPIIQNLSMYAQEYSRWAEIVAQCIEAHIRRVSGRSSCVHLTLGRASWHVDRWTCRVSSLEYFLSLSLSKDIDNVPTPLFYCGEGQRPRLSFFFSS